MHSQPGRVSLSTPTLLSNRLSRALSLHGRPVAVVFVSALWRFLISIVSGKEIKAHQKEEKFTVDAATGATSAAGFVPSSRNDRFCPGDTRDRFQITSNFQELPSQAVTCCPWRETFSLEGTGHSYRFSSFLFYLIPTVSSAHFFSVTIMPLSLSHPFRPGLGRMVL